jgi:hypothetical protein
LGGTSKPGLLQILDSIPLGRLLGHVRSPRGVERGAALRVALCAGLGLGGCGRGNGPLQRADGGRSDAPFEVTSPPHDADAAAETGEASACGEGATDDPGFVLEGLSGGPGIAILVSAVVDESTPTRLTFTLLEDRDAADRTHVTVRGTPAPMLPVGRIAWFTYVVDNGDTFGLSPSPWALIVRAHEGGPILFGISQQRSGQTLTPFGIVGGLSSVCDFGACPRTFVQALTVPDASPPTIPNGGSATIAIASNLYRLWVHAETQNLTPGPCDAAGFVPPLPIALTYVAKDLAALADQLGAPTP